MRVRAGRSAIALASAVLAAAAMLLAAGVASAAPLRVEIKTTSQSKAIERGAIRVRAKAPAATDARIKLKSRIAGKTRRISKRKEIQLARRWKKFNVRLRRHGVRRISRCVPQRLKARLATDAGAARDRARLRLTACGGPGEGPDDRGSDDPGSDDPVGESAGRRYEISPAGAARHANGTPRALEVSGSDGEALRLALFECDNVSPAGDDVAFAASGGEADQGDPAGGFESVNGSPAAGSPSRVGPVASEGGEIDVEISGADGCVTLAAFDDRDGDGGLDVDSGGVPTEPYGAGGATSFEALGDVQLGASDRCDFTDPALCLFPWPNDRFTISDPATDTGRRLNLAAESMPRNRLDQPIQPADYNRNDGFSPGQMIVTKVPGLETQAAFEATGAPPITDLSESLAADSPVVVIDADTGERQLLWSEIDANPQDPADVALLIRPAVNFEEGHRYIVALRDLRNAEGEPITAQRPFEIYRDRVVTSEPAIESRRPHFEEIFDTLEAAAVEREDLYLAWDFTVASERNLTERMLSIRDDAFAQLGDTDLADMEVEGAAPTFAVTGVTDYAPCGDDGCDGGLDVPLEIPVFGDLGDLPLVGGILGPTEDQLATLLGSPPEDDRIARKVEGQFLVPCYTNLPGCLPGSQFAFSGPTDTIPDPVPGNVATANFTCLIPRSAAGAGAEPARPSLYGHGLLGSAGEVNAGHVKAMSNEHNFVFCATDWAGFATQDLPIIAAALQDLSVFPKIADRIQQGFLNFLFLGRLMIHEEGFSASPAFRLDGRSVIDRTRLFYDGNSQGGILGGSLTAVAPDFDRAVLGVPGMNYSTLLRRSSDFAPYAEGEFVDGADTPVGLYDNYPDELERPLILSMIQVLWDRGEANGYAHHITDDPLPNTPPHEALLHVAFGDHQVTMWSAEVEARTIGAYRHAPTTDPGRHPDTNPYFAIPPIPSYPFEGSGLVVFDSGPPRADDQGVIPPPTTNTPPGNPEHGRDPHSDPRNDPMGRVQKSEFLRVDGKIVNVCDGHPCYAHGWTGP